MKIAFDVSYIQTKRAGYGRFSLELLKALIEHDRENKYLLHGWSFSLDMNELLKFKGANVELRSARIPGFFKRAYWNTLRAPKLETLIGDFDLFHGAEPMLPPTGKKKIATLYDLSYKKFPQFFESGVLDWDPYVTRTVNEADSIIVPSINTKNDLVSFFSVPPEKVRVVHLPAAKCFSPERSKEDVSLQSRYGLGANFILFTGSLEPRKNIPLLIKAFEQVHQNHLDIQLVLAGKRGWLFEEIFKVLERSPAKQNIRYLDYVPEQDLAALYRSSLFFVYLSLYEGYGLPVIEAMASGTPVITSNSSSLGEIGEGAAILIDPTRVDELVAAMESLYSNPPLRQDFSLMGLSRAKEFSRAAAAGTVLDLYRMLGTK